MRAIVVTIEADRVIGPADGAAAMGGDSPKCVHGDDWKMPELRQDTTRRMD
jgi:hypothetical protein